VEAAEAPRLSSQIEALDYLVGGGWVAGCAYFLVAEPGTGKSTLALDVSARWSGSAYLTSEESAGAIRLRAERIGCDLDAIESVGEITEIEALDELPPACRVVVVDSINGLASNGLGKAGSNAQLVHATGRAVAWARARRGVALLIGQVNGDGEAAGAAAVRHMVDCLIWAARPTDTPNAPFKLWTDKNRHGELREITAQHTARGLAYARVDESAEDDPEDHHRGAASAGDPHAAGHDGAPAFAGRRVDR
jgi:DNA repair protein RadA/Sms